MRGSILSILYFIVYIVSIKINVINYKKISRKLLFENFKYLYKMDF